MYQKLCAKTLFPHRVDSRAHQDTGTLVCISHPSAWTNRVCRKETFLWANMGHVLKLKT